ncbi:N-acetylglucosamine kinase [Nonomuraea africana]|uniref:N-acetylglucosamine kinase-like BadF-type ATPase n=1 Tax=Nonomuraea africana TaxID=46171 RepID=A0ABR9KF30_9ACTN|nr:BadF/BadG/BcrA/BcrD ATPase family protein [Nonomuraea africana]MBE1560590.1 N-acetylglucosamine kinase-like BadF-type ATPase [Nonomuraea africana]
MRTVLAVDGGNSKTDVALVAEDGTVLATGRGGGFLPQSAGVPAAADVVEEVVRQALGPLARALGTTVAAPYGDLMSAYLAGADLPREEEALREEFAARGFAPDVVVGNDTFALLRAGASGPWGVAVVCGAGINAVGVSPDGQVARFPALGKVSGDWGGGLGLAEEVLWHAIRAEDGRGGPTALAALVTEHFGTATVEEVALGLHFGELEQASLHGLTPGLFAVAAAGDPIARSLVERMAEEIVLLAEVCLRRLGLTETPTEVVLGGGVLRARDPLLSALLDERFTARAPQAKLVVADLPPIVGAALSGLDRMGAGEAAKARLRGGFGDTL